MPVWNKANAQHLLSRCLFGFNRQDVRYALSKSLNDFVDNDILGAAVQPTAPNTWVSEKPVSNNNTVDRQREKEMSIWWLKLMLNDVKIIVAEILGDIKRDCLQPFFTIYRYQITIYYC